MSEVRPFFIGFRVKQVVAADFDSLRNSVVKHERAEICSMSDCMARAPAGWESRWDFNDACCYNSEAQALATIPQGDDAHYELFAYRMLPAEFGTAGERTLTLPQDFDVGIRQVTAEVNLDEYSSIGYDIAGGPFPSPEYGSMLGFSCSPLSCNAMSDEHAVNRFWLIDQLERAIQVAREFGRTEPEPGPYYVYEVLRKRSPRWSAAGTG